MEQNNRFAKVKAIVDAIREANPEFLETPRICDDLLDFIEEMEKDADVAAKIDEFRGELEVFQQKVNVLSDVVNNLEDENRKVKASLDAVKGSFVALEQNLIFNMESERARNKKLDFVLDELGQYLRRHS